MVQRRIECVCVEELVLEVGNIVNFFIVPALVVAGVVDVVWTLHDCEVLLQAHRDLRQHLTLPLCEQNGKIKLTHAHKQLIEWMYTRHTQ